MLGWREVAEDVAFQNWPGNGEPLRRWGKGEVEVGGPRYSVEPGSKYGEGETEGTGREEGG